jgi:hypothetical protein
MQADRLSRLHGIRPVAPGDSEWGSTSQRGTQPAARFLDRRSEERALVRCTAVRWSEHRSRQDASCQP